MRIQTPSHEPARAAAAAAAAELETPPATVPSTPVGSARGAPPRRGEVVLARPFGEWRAQARVPPTLAEALARAKAPFTDREFGGERALYCLDASRAPRSYLKGGTRAVAWVRAAELEPALELWGAAAAASTDGVKQGALGDCYFLSAIARLAAERGTVERLLIDAGPGAIGVRLCDYDGWRTVLVDDRLAVDERTRLPLFCAPRAAERALWACALEKAFAKLHGAYQNIEGGAPSDALAYLTAGHTGTIRIRSVEHEAEGQAPSGTRWQDALWRRVVEMHQTARGGQRCVLLASDVAGSKARDIGDESAEPEEGGGGLLSSMVRKHALVPRKKRWPGIGEMNVIAETADDPGHSFAVLRVHEGLGHRLLRLCNPWGRREWKGAFSDKSSVWTAELKAEFGWDEAKGGHRDETDGIFWMPWADFLEQFESVSYTYVPAEAAPSVHVTSEWRAELTAGGVEALAGYNPRFVLSLNRARAPARAAGARDAAGSPARVAPSPLTHPPPSGLPSRRAPPLRTVPSGRAQVFLALTQPGVRHFGGGGHLEMYLQVFRVDTARAEQPPRLEDKLDGGEIAISHRRGSLALELDPGGGAKTFVLVASLWEAGWEGSFGLTVVLADAMGAPDARIAVRELEPSAPPEAHARLMRRPPVWESCATCRQPCPIGRGDDFEWFRGVRWHSGACCKCAKCGVLLTAARQARKHTGGPSARQGVHAVHAQAGRVQGFCEECHRADFAYRCLQCGEPIDGAEPWVVLASADEEAAGGHGAAAGADATPRPFRKVHASCRDAYRQASADVCVACQQPILESSYYQKEEGRVHHSGDCLARYHEAHADRCAGCGLAILGKYVELELEDGGGTIQLHADAECKQRYLAQHGPRCIVCGEPVLGSTFYSVAAEDGGGAAAKVHSEAERADCMRRHKESRAPKCAVCSKPILGACYEMDGADGSTVRVHAESEVPDCIGEYDRAQAARA